MGELIGSPLQKIICHSERSEESRYYYKIVVFQKSQLEISEILQVW